MLSSISSVIFAQLGHQLTSEGVSKEGEGSDRVLHSRL